MEIPPVGWLSAKRLAECGNGFTRFVFSGKRNAPVQELREGRENSRLNAKSALMAEGLSRLQMRRWKKLSLRTEDGFLVSDSQAIRGVGALVDVFPQGPGDAEGHVRWCGVVAFSVPFLSFCVHEADGNQNKADNYRR